MKKQKFREIISLAWRAFRNYRRQIFLLTAIGFFSGFIEVVGLNALIPVLAFASGNTGPQSDAVTRIMQKIFATFGLQYHLIYLLIFISLIFIIKAVTMIATTYVKFKTTADYELYTRNDLLEKTLNARWPYLMQQKVGYLENVLMSDVHVAGLFLQHISNLLLAGVTLIVYTVAAIHISAVITLITIGLGIVLFLVFKPLISRKRLFAIEVVKVRKHITHFINEHIIGMKVIKSLAITDGIVRRGGNFFRYCRDLNLKLAVYSNIAIATVQPVSFIYLIVLFALLYKTPNFQFAEFIVVVYLINRIFTYIEQLQGNIHKLNDTFPYVESVLLYDLEIIKNKEPMYGKTTRFLFNNVLVFEGVRFRYEIGRDVLKNVNLTVPKGIIAGIIGSSGAGKTTIVDLLLRLLQPSEGRILLDGTDIEDISIQTWRQQVGYVSQDIFLFNDTIANNTKMYSPAISNEEMIEATKMADIFDFIDYCPEKFETVIGERGMKLSVGQRQRLALARILVRKPQILILDEATSALDSESEMRIQRVIERFRGKMTILMIAHRLSTVMNCDKLFVLANGEIVEEGSPQDLLKDTSSYFYKVYHIRQ